MTKTEAKITFNVGDRVKHLYTHITLILQRKLDDDTWEAVSAHSGPVGKIYKVASIALVKA